MHFRLKIKVLIEVQLNSPEVEKEKISDIKSKLLSKVNSQLPQQAV